MLKEILAVSGKPGLYKLVSRGKNMLIIESLSEEKKRLPAYPHDKVISLGDVSVYLEDGELPVREILTSIKEKEQGNKLPFDYTKANNDEIREYFAAVVPNYDKYKVYPTDMKKVLKWYDILISNGMDDFSKIEVEEVKDEEKSDENKEETAADKAAVKPKTAAAAAPKRKPVTAVQAPKTAAKAKATPKAGAPKKSVVGAKRGS